MTLTLQFAAVQIRGTTAATPTRVGTGTLTLGRSSAALTITSLLKGGSTRKCAQVFFVAIGNWKVKNFDYLKVAPVYPSPKQVRAKLHAPRRAFLLPPQAQGH